MKTKDVIYLDNEKANYLIRKADVKKFDKRFIALDDFRITYSGDGGANHYDYKWDWVNCSYTVTLRYEDGETFAKITNRAKDGDWNNAEGLLEYEDERVKEHLLARPDNLNGLAVKDGISVLFMLVNVWLCSLVSVEEAVKKTTRTVTESSGAPKKKGRRGKRRVYLLNEYTLRPNYQEARTHAPHVFSCPAWGVRGHYRHYKDGRVIFIKPYIKGKKKTDYKAKEYVLTEGE